MTLADLIALTLALLFFGGSSGVFTFISTRLLLEKLQQMGFFMQTDLPSE